MIVFTMRAICAAFATLALIGAFAGNYPLAIAWAILALCLAPSYWMDDNVQDDDFFTEWN